MIATTNLPQASLMITLTYTHTHTYTKTHLYSDLNLEKRALSNTGQ